MKTGLSIIFSLGLVVLSVILSEMLKFNVVTLMIFTTALWAAWDSSKIHLKKYRSGISFGPLLIFICHIGLWIIAFPWYLTMKYKIKNGLALLKEEGEKQRIVVASPKKIFIGVIFGSAVILGLFYFFG
jgi:lysylphosphatidylglycerol synthetase-like protein (DUF2156 family)